MTKKNKRVTTDKGFPIDDRPVIFNLHEDGDINFVGRYIESDNMFMLSLNDEESDFVPEMEIGEWWYIDEHPIILNEVINKKSLKKSLKKSKIKNVRNLKNKMKSDDSEKKTNSELISNTQSFKVPNLPPIPEFLKVFVHKFQQQTGVQFEQVNVRVVGEDDLNDLPKEVLEQLLEKAVADEYFELATKLRNAINSK